MTRLRFLVMQCALAAALTWAVWWRGVHGILHLLGVPHPEVGP